MMRSTVCLILAVFAVSTGAFHVAPVNPSRQSSTSLNIFGDALKGAFSNDDTLGKAKSAGLSNGPDVNDQVTVNGKKVQGAVVGQKLTAVAMKARVKIPVNCQKGDCGTCMVTVNGRKLKACQTALGKGKTTIST